MKPTPELLAQCKKRLSEYPYDHTQAQAIREQIADIEKRLHINQEKV